MTRRWQHPLEDVILAFSEQPPLEQAKFEEKAVSGTDRIRRQQILREAEGYLDLAVLFNEDWPLADARRHQLAQRAITTLDRLHGSAAEGAEALYLRGLALRTMSRFAEALTPLELAAQADPQNIDIWLALGWCYKRVNRLDMAIEALESARESQPSAAILHYNLACYWSLARNHRKAIDFLQNALKLDDHYRMLLNAEPDFDPIRDDPEFRDLTTVIV